MDINKEKNGQRLTDPRDTKERSASYNNGNDNVTINSLGGLGLAGSTNKLKPINLRVHGEKQKLSNTFNVFVLIAIIYSGLL